MFRTCFWNSCKVLRDLIRLLRSLEAPYKALNALIGACPRALRAKRLLTISVLHRPKYLDYLAQLPMN